MPFITAKEEAGLSRTPGIDGVDAVVLAGQRVAVDWVQTDTDGNGLTIIRLAGNYTCPETHHLIPVGQERYINCRRFEIPSIAWIQKEPAAQNARMVSRLPDQPPQALQPAQPQARLGPLKTDRDKAQFLIDGLSRVGFSPGPFSDLSSPACTSVVTQFQKAEGLDVDGKAGPETFGALSERLLPDSNRPDATGRFPVEVVAQMFADAPLTNIRVNLPPVLNALRSAQLCDQEMILMALATIRAETAGFVPIDEFVSKYNTVAGGAPFGQYDYRDDLGNQGPPDGDRFKGRGFIQLTGRHNYKEIGHQIGVDLIASPERANEPNVAALILAAFLKRKKRRIRGCLLLDDLGEARRAVNGGSHGLGPFTEAYRTGQRLTGDLATTAVVSSGVAPAVQAEADRPPPTESVRPAYDPSAPINWNDPKCRISKYFTVAEVTQGDRERIPAKGSEIESNILRLARELDRVREAWGLPIGVTSWYRPPAVNARVGGVSDSQHLYGCAADIYTMDALDQWHPRNKEFEQWLDSKMWSDQALGYGCAANRGFTHVDLRKGRIRWNY